MTEHIQVVPDKCRACRRCEVACIAAHHGMSFKEAMKHRDELVSRVQVVKAEGFKTTVRCHQCAHAPCVNVCPTGALQQDEEGRIIMRVQYCVACKMCIAACPYGTISLDSIGMPSVDGEEGETIAQRARREVAVRCDMCRAWRMENGKRITACMEACPAHALSLVLADGSVLEAPMPEKKPAVDGAAPRPAAPAEPGPRPSVTAAAKVPEAPKPEEAKPAEAAPKAEAAPQATPTTQAPVAETPQAAAPAQAAPVTETPEQAKPAPAAPEATTPEVATPKAEAPAEEAASEAKAATPAPTVKVPVQDAPVVEEAAPEAKETPAPRQSPAAQPQATPKATAPETPEAAPKTATKAAPKATKGKTAKKPSRKSGKK